MSDWMRVSTWCLYVCFFDLAVVFFSSGGRHTRCALVTGVQTGALPIWLAVRAQAEPRSGDGHPRTGAGGLPPVRCDDPAGQSLPGAVPGHGGRDRKSVV